MSEIIPDLRAPELPLTFVKPAVGSFTPSVDAAMSRKSERGMPASMAAIILQSPSGQFWRVSVSDQGNLVISPMVRT